MKRLIILLLVAICGLVFWQALLLIPENETALLIRFGKPYGQAMQPGWHWKVPIIDKVVRFDKRIQLLETEPLEIPTSDSRMIAVKVVAYWQLTAPDTLLRTVGNQSAASRRLAELIESSLRNELGRYQLVELVRPQKVRLDSKQWQSIECLAASEEQRVLASKNLGAGQQIEEQVSRQVLEQLARDPFGVNLLGLKIQRLQFIKRIE
jgi:membrane protease subunit HflC